MAIPVLSYGFGIIDWPQIEIDNLDLKTRKNYPNPQSAI